MTEQPSKSHMHASSDGSSALMVELREHVPFSVSAVAIGLCIAGAICVLGFRPGDPGAIELVRRSDDGRNVVYVLDLEKVQNGKQDDIPVEPGDVVRVPAYFPRLATARFVRFVENIFGIGARIDD